MKNVLSKSLKDSLMQERKAVEQKHNNLEFDKFAKADQLFDTKIVDVEKASIKNLVIKDSFSIPEKDYRLINECKNKLLKLGINSTKSEIIRAGLILISQFSDDNLINAINNVDKIKTGRRSSKK